MGFLDKQGPVQWDCPEKVRETTQAIRARVVESGTTISGQQNRTVKEIPAKRSTWFSKFTIPPPPEGEIRDSLLRAMDKGNVGEVVYARPLYELLDAQ